MKREPIRKQSIGFDWSTKNLSISGILKRIFKKIPLVSSSNQKPKRGVPMATYGFWGVFIAF